jgi:hypothetical protein
MVKITALKKLAWAGQGRAGQGRAGQVLMIIDSLGLIGSF